MKYQGFLKDAHIITNGSVAHNQWNVDEEGDEGMEALCPFEENSLSPVQWKVIRQNKVDANAKNVVYSTIQRVDGDHIEFAYFHTNGNTHPVGTILKSGDVLCYLAWNGDMDGFHIHLSPRYNNMKTNVNPANVVVTTNGKIEKGQYVLGQPKPITEPMNIQKGSVVEVTADKINIRETTDPKSKDLGDVFKGNKLPVLENSVVANGFEWIKIDRGYVAVQVMSTGEEWVKVVQLPETCEMKLAKVTAENIELKKQLEDTTKQLEDKTKRLYDIHLISA